MLRAIEPSQVGHARGEGQGARGGVGGVLQGLKESRRTTGGDHDADHLRLALAYLVDSASVAEATDRMASRMPNGWHLRIAHISVHSSMSWWLTVAAGGHPRPRPPSRSLPRGLARHERWDRRRSQLVAACHPIACREDRGRRGPTRTPIARSSSPQAAAVVYHSPCAPRSRVLCPKTGALVHPRVGRGRLSSARASRSAELVPISPARERWRSGVAREGVRLRRPPAGTSVTSATAATVLALGRSYD
jgi:hypothetical protein